MALVMTPKSISILGYGWVGKAFIEKMHSHYNIKASVATQSSFDNLTHRQKYLLNEDNAYKSSDFYRSDIIIIAIPPRGNYFQNIEKIFENISSHSQIILLSSTSVYGKGRDVFSESDSKTVKNPSIMLQTEHFLKKNHKKFLILRLGGLMGYDRIAGKYTAGKSLEHDAIVNYIHRDDVVNIIHHLINEDITQDTINVVAPEHPCKKEIYDNNATIFGFEPTIFITLDIVQREISSEKLLEKYKYQFLKPNPLEFW
jgi:nucleoside-diphosphate-sugar epimerase